MRTGLRAWTVPASWQWLALAAGCVLLAAAADAAEPARPPLEPCGPAENPADARCGFLEVPEDPRHPEGRRISLPLVVLPSVEGTTGESALFELDGGPGLTSTDSKDFFLGPGRAFRRGRDVVLLDQRGTGHGPHALRCPALERRGPLDDDYDPAAVEACREELARRADLTLYGTSHAAGDLDHARAALGYERIDLWALSYGTKLAQVYMKRFPGRVRTAFLVGTVPIDLRTPLFHAAAAQRVLDAVFADCQLDAACRAAYPDLRAEWGLVLARLEAGPVRASAPDSGAGEGRTVEIRRGAFGEAFRGLLATTTGQREIPRIVHRAAAGDWGPFLARMRKGPSPFAEGEYLSVECTESAPRIAPADVAAATSGTFLNDYRVRGQLGACATWPRGELPADFFAPAADPGASVLVLSGEADHVAPPEWSAAVCGALPRCRLVSVPSLGHAPFDLDSWGGGAVECFDGLAIELLATGDAERVDASCVRAMVPPAFAVDPPEP
jgi:pimeloyl-ACP methyl ester carboxylesterase